MTPFLLYTNWKIRGKDDLLDENEQFLNILIESYDKITTREECSLEISEMGKDIGLERRESNSGNGAAVSISGGIITTPQGIPDLRMLNTGFNDSGKLIIQVA